MTERKLRREIEDLREVSGYDQSEDSDSEGLEPAIELSNRQRQHIADLADEFESRASEDELREFEEAAEKMQDEPRSAYGAESNARFFEKSHPQIEPLGPGTARVIELFFDVDTTGSDPSEDSD